MVASADPEGTTDGGADEALAADAGSLELTKGLVVQEVGWDEDCAPELSEAIEDQVGSELLDDDTDEVVDVVLLWWREGDGDLVDRLMDVMSPLADDGCVWVFTPKTGESGHVEPAVIAESAQTAGMLQTKTGSLGEWAGARLALRKGSVPKR